MNVDDLGGTWEGVTHLRPSADVLKSLEVKQVDKLEGTIILLSITFVLNLFWI